MLAVAIYSKASSKTDSVLLFENPEKAMNFVKTDAEDYYKELCRTAKDKRKVVLEIAEEVGHAVVGRVGTEAETYTWDILKVG